MQRWSALVLFGILLACAALLVLRVGPAATRGGGTWGGGPVAGPSASVSASPSASASAGPLGLATSGSGPAEELAPLEDPDVKPGGAQLPTGEPAPALPDGAPKTVVFGVVLVEYRGAQGATRRTRPREAADTLAKELAAEARNDFAATVAKGDPGSAANAGLMPRGVLEAGPEHVLFSLAVGEVGGPVDTPRGLWIVKRLE